MVIREINLRKAKILVAVLITIVCLGMSQSTSYVYAVPYTIQMGKFSTDNSFPSINFDIYLTGTSPGLQTIDLPLEQMAVGEIRTAIIYYDIDAVYDWTVLETKTDPADTTPYALTGVDFSLYYVNIIDQSSPINLPGGDWQFTFRTGPGYTVPPGENDLLFRVILDNTQPVPESFTITMLLLAGGYVGLMGMRQSFKK